MKNYEYEYEYRWLIVSKIRLFRDITANIEMSKFRFNVIFANNFLRKRKKKKRKKEGCEKLCFQMVSYVYFGLINPTSRAPYNVA